MIKSQRDREITREIHRLFWRANFQDTPSLIIGYLFRIPSVALYNTFIPLASAYGVEAIIAHDMVSVTKYAWSVVGLSLIYCILRIIGDFAIAKNAIASLKYLQHQVFMNFIHKDHEFFTSTYTGSLGAEANRLRDAGNSYGEIVTLSIPRNFTIVISGLAVIAYQSIELAAITLLAMIAVLSFTFWSSTWRLQFRRRVSEASSLVSGALGDALSHGQTVKSFATEDYEEQRLNKVFLRWTHEQYWSWISAIPGDTGRLILAAIATASLLAVSAKLYDQGTISITIIVLIQLYVLKLVATTIDIAEIIKRYEEAMGSAYQTVKTMLVPTTVNDVANPSQLPKSKEYTLAFDKVKYRYDEAGHEQYAVTDFSLKIEPGEKIGLVGYSGSGKTTLTKLLLRFMDVTEGEIRINGQDIRQISQKALRDCIAYVPQEPLLFHRSISENIGYAKPLATHEDIAQAAKQAYLDEFISELPRAYDTEVGERGVKLSGGQRQRVAIARALLKDSPILVLDEATSALDSKSEKHIQDALWKLMKNRTALVIAHRLSTIQRLDRIVVMDKGRIVQVGSHEELKSQSGIYADLWEHQSGGYIGVRIDGTVDA